MKMIDVKDLVDSGEFAELLGIKRRTVLNYLHRARERGFPQTRTGGRFPKPACYIGGSKDEDGPQGKPMWLRKDAARYVKNRPGPGWHEKGDARVAAFIRSHEPAGAGAGAEPQ